MRTIYVMAAALFFSACSLYHPEIELEIYPPVNQHPMALLQSSELYYRLEWVDQGIFSSRILCEKQSLRISASRHSPLFFSYYPVYNGITLSNNPAGGMYLPVPGFNSIQLSWAKGPSVQVLSRLSRRDLLPPDFNLARYSRMPPPFAGTDPWDLNIVEQSKRILTHSFSSIPPAALEKKQITLRCLSDGILISENPFQSVAIPVEGEVSLNLTASIHIFVQPQSRTVFYIEPGAGYGEFYVYREIY